MKESVGTGLFEKYSEKPVGVWVLVSRELYTSDEVDGKCIALSHGDVPLGRVIISKSGYLSGVLVPPSVMEPVDYKELTLAFDAEVARVRREVTCYMGKMEVQEREDGGLLWHTAVEVSNNPNNIGKMQTRRADFSEEEGVLYMTLRPVNWYTRPERFQLCVWVSESQGR